MDMREASAMTEASGLTNEQGGIEQASGARPSAKAEAERGASAAPRGVARRRDALRRSVAQDDHQGSAAVAFRRVLAGRLGRASALGDGRGLKKLSGAACALVLNAHRNLMPRGSRAILCHWLQMPPRGLQWDQTSQESASLAMW